MATQPEVRLLILQGTPFCNIDCRYCYLPQRSDKRRMRLGTLDTLVQRLLDEALLGRHLTINWHAGEPLVLGIPFYEDALERLRPLSSRGTHVVHSVQTNGTLIDDHWAAFFKKAGMRVGVSVDGPRAIHDAYRKDRRGRGTYDRVMEGIGNLQDAGVPFSVISVITDASVDHADAIYRFYVDHGIRVVGFNIEETEGVNEASSVSTGGFPARYREFLRRFFELARRDGVLRVREFEYFRGRILSERFRTNDQVIPLAILSVDSSGRFSTFSPELLDASSIRHGDFIFGNVHENSLRSAFETEKFQAVFAEIAEGVQACHDSCEYFGVCGGGAPSNKHFENGRLNSTETDYCRYMKKALAEAVMKELERGIEPMGR